MEKEKWKYIIFGILGILGIVVLVLRFLTGESIYKNLGFIFIFLSGSIIELSKYKENKKRGSLIWGVIFVILLVINSLDLIINLLGIRI
ncbi:DUF6442 family protein [Miniphocaeibacter massiliensis]|uniref:DUF6442 family protein n=1 Tax=Miniphocaeibacter massiliensis TaxID=2041841 RepID=UPI000C1C0BD8|nr:DUF6442 family protein [Miniphocaeibacter massiliensis]